MITDINQLDFTKTYSYADYYTWEFDDRVELFKGKIFEIGPSSGTRHQEVSRELAGNLWNSLKGKPHQLYIAPFDVRLVRSGNSIKDEDVFTVVQPDLCIICDESKLDERGAIGVPDLIIEILLPGNCKKEMSHKYELYQEAGVLEYWMVNLLDKTIFIYVLKNGVFIGQQPLTEDSQIKSPLFPQLNFQVADIFN